MRWHEHGDALARRVGAHPPTQFLRNTQLLGIVGVNLLPKLAARERFDMEAFDTAAAGDEDAAVGVGEALVGRHTLHPLREAYSAIEDRRGVLDLLRAGARSKRGRLLDHEQAPDDVRGLVFEWVSWVEETVDHVVFSHVRGKVEVRGGQVGFFERLLGLQHAHVHVFVHSSNLGFEREGTLVVIGKRNMDFIPLWVFHRCVDAMQGGDGLAVHIHEARRAHTPLLSSGSFHFFRLRCVHYVNSADMAHDLLKGRLHPFGPLDVIGMVVLMLKVTCDI